MKLSMPLFKISDNRSLNPIGQRNFRKEKVLQDLIEKNLEAVFDCRFVASEYATGAQHAGRIDTLALSEDSNPVILEYKKTQSSDLINQSLFYLAWLDDHRGDFEVAARHALGKVEIDWSAIRVICVAPNYRRYDLYAVQVMGANIELWTYRLFDNKTLFLEEVLQKSADSGLTGTKPSKDPKMVAAGKKAAITRATATYAVEDHFEGKPGYIRDLGLAISEFITGLDPSIREVPKKQYIAYKTTKNIVCMEMKKAKIHVFLKLDPKKHPGPDGISRDVSSIGHYGTGDLEITIRKEEDFEAAKASIELAYQGVGS